MPPPVDPVLSGSAGPEGVRTALRSAPVRGAVRRALAGLLAPGAVLGPVHLERVKLKPGRKLSVWGRAAVLDGAGRRWRVPVAATWVPATTMSSAPPLDGLAGPLRAGHAVDEPIGMELLASPFDPAAPELVELHEPSTVPERPLVSILRYRPRQRHVLRYDAVSGPGRPCWAKLVPGRDGAAAVATATALADGLAGREDAAVLRPLRLLAGGAVLFPHAPGRPLPALLGAGRPWPEEPLRRCAAALRQLHHLPLEALPSGRLGVLEEELAGVARAGEHLAALDPPAAQLLESVLDAARSALAGAAEVAPGHGDCKLDHLWLDRRTVTFIDVDSAVMADPARDVGKLLADLRWWTIRTGTPGLDAARAAVAAGYDAGGVPERWSRATAWEGLLLAKAVVRRTSLLEADWTARTRAGLRDSSAVLDARRTERVPVAAVV